MKKLGVILAILTIRIAFGLGIFGAAGYVHGAHIVSEWFWPACLLTGMASFVVVGLIF